MQPRLGLSLAGLFIGARLYSAPATPVAASGAYLGDSLGSLDKAPGDFQAPSLFPTLINVTLSLLFVVALIYAAYWILRRVRAGQGLAKPGEPVGLFRVLEKHHFDNRRGMVAVEMDNKIFLLGLGEQVTTLAEFSDPAAVERLRAATPTPSGLLNFSESLEKIGIHVRREQWKRSKQSLKERSHDLDRQLGRLKKKSGENPEDE